MSDGAFIGYVPIDPNQIGSDSVFTFVCKAVSHDSVYTFERKVKVPVSPKPFDSAKAAIDLNYLFPTDSVSLPAGERVRIACRATPGADVRFDVISPDGVVLEKDWVMGESGSEFTDDSDDSVFGVGKKAKRANIQGVYNADYKIHSSLKYARIRIRVKKNGETITAETPGRISAWDDAQIRVVELTGEINNATVDPGRAYYYFLPKGVRCALDGKNGNRIRLKLSGEHTAWIPEKNAVYLPPGTPVPQTFIPIVRVKREGQKSVLTLVMSEKIPFRIEQTGERQLQLWLYGGISDTDWIRFENRNDDVRSVRWTQPEPDVYSLIVDLKEAHYWGYDAKYDGTQLQWTIRHKPKTQGLRGLKICIDPGHSKDIGSTGPRGVTERQVNVEVAWALKKELESDGVIVTMTHADTSQNATLYERVKTANENGSDLFISIHHNALPDGVNPFGQPLGPSVIYYHPQSKKLADLIQPELVKRLQLPDYGIFHGNIAVLRNAQMPAVLVECAFLILPEQEQRIVDAKFQKQAALGIKEGIKKFIK